MKAELLQRLDYARTVFSQQRGLEKNFEPAGEPLSNQDFYLITGITDNLRYRVTAISFVTDSIDLSTDEKIGTVLFVGLVNIADDLLDSKEEIRRINNRGELRSILLQQPAIVNKKPLSINSKPATVEDLMNYTLGKFPEAKQQAITHFLDHVITIESQVTDTIPGHYSFEEAQTYRKQTSEAYDRIGLTLINITDPEAIEKHVKMAMATQLLDDVMDCFSDFKDKAINPIIAYAYENREGNILEEYAKHAPTKLLKRVIYTKIILKHLPKTRNAFRKMYTELTDGSKESRLLGKLFL